MSANGTTQDAPVIPPGFTHRIEPRTAIQQAASKETSRYAISGVTALASITTPNAGWLVATDGRMLAAAECGLIAAPGRPACPIVPHVLLKGDPTVILAGGAECKAHYRKGPAKVGEPVEGNFPPFADLVPQASDDEIHWITLDAALLGRLAEALAADDARSVTIGIRRDGKPKPYLVMPNDSSVSLGLLMPIALLTKDELTGQQTATQEWNRRATNLVNACRPPLSDEAPPVTPAVETPVEEPETAEETEVEETATAAA